MGLNAGTRRNLQKLFGNYHLFGVKRIHTIQGVMLHIEPNKDCLQALKKALQDRVQHGWSIVTVTGEPYKVEL